MERGRERGRGRGRGRRREETRKHDEGKETYMYKCNITRLHTVFSIHREIVWHCLAIPGEELQAKGWGNIKLCGSHKIESVPSDVQEVQSLPTILNTQETVNTNEQ